ncbi:MAG: hypothetical protein HC903_18085 [Methylacidiphilales bacterium]|nr:hypothetical protein [Candidatus Methylacidiphilales bacterium]
MKSRTSLITKATGLIALFCGAIALIFLFNFGSALTQEPDTSNIIKTAMQIQFNRTSIAAVADNKQRFLVRKLSGLKLHLEQQGWIFVEQIAGFTFYRKRTERLSAKCRSYTRNYLICNLARIP